MSSLYRLPSEELKVKSENNDILSPSQDLENNGKPFGHCFESIHIFNDQSVVIASDNLQGLRHDGFVTKYKQIEDVPQLPVLSLTPNFGGICNLIGLRNKKLICGFDSGHIAVLSEELEEELAIIYHENQINRLNVNRLETKTVSCGYDYSIVVLDLQTFMPNKCYNFGHSDIVWDIDFSPSDDNLLLSCSRDKDVLVWDLRNAKPATKLTALSSEPTAICWSTKDISQTYVGTSCGEILQFDVRKPGHEVNVEFDSIVNRVHRIKNVLNGNAFAICADDNVFRLLSPELKCIHEDRTSHSNWIRDIAQYNQTLYSVGRDSQLIRHSGLNPCLNS